MKTPIADFVRRYGAGGTLRLHMPGHKGRGPLGVESLDITEIQGADSLYEASGVIRESEENASGLFGCPTYYSVEGSSQCIRAMVYLALLRAKAQGRRPLIAAGRNAHRTFLSALALLDVEVLWLMPRAGEGYLSCTVEPEDLEKAFLGPEKPTAVYITSPDYLGNMADIEALSAVCRKHGALLLVDNAHGAYLRFLPRSAHPMDLGADLCCDSAHKTLPVLTGGAYLHTAQGWEASLVRQGLALFGSTSPSYLILQSLDLANVYLDGHKDRLANFLPKVDGAKERLVRAGFTLRGQEPMKITLSARDYGYPGTALARLLGEAGMECEFADPDHLVLMVTPETGEEGLQRLVEALCAIKPGRNIPGKLPAMVPGEQVLSCREAMLAPSEEVAAEAAQGRILAAPSVGCPPAVPIVICGQRIGPEALEAFRYYGIERISVVK